MSEHVAKPGRPRSPEADEAILAAARELMAEGGLAQLTVEGTAQRAGVAKTTVYRRYPSKLDLAVAAVAALIADTPPGDNLEDATDAGLNLMERNWGPPGAQAAYLAVAAAAAQDADVHERFKETVLEPVGTAVADLYRNALERGEAAGGQDLDFMHDVLVGTLLHRLVICRTPLDDDFRARYTALVRFVYGDPH
jgi:AcrR family transcriptional regulator